MAWVLLAVVLLFLHSALPNWMFGRWVTPFSWVLGIAILFHVLNGLLVWACVAWLNPLLARRYPQRLAPRMVFGLLVATGGVLLIIIAVYGYLFPAVLGRPVYPGGLFDISYRALMAVVFVYGWLLLSAYASAQAARTLQLQLETDTLATDLDRSELAMLEAQIEPHFLFNTLAHIKRLYRVGDAAADHVLESLIDYLERALPALRDTAWTVGDELALVELYLDLIAQRFGERFSFSIQVSEQARGFTLPALTIATLVENAVRHGLGPKAGNGRIEIAVDSTSGALAISVSDNGVGLRQSSGNGLGLATVRARLKSCFGSRAGLLVAPGTQAGVQSSITIAAGAAHA